MSIQPAALASSRQPSTTKHTTRNIVLIVWPLVFMVAMITLCAMIAASSTNGDDASGYVIILVAMLSVFVWPFGIVSLIWGITHLAMQLSRPAKTRLGHILVWSPGAMLLVGAIVHDAFFKNNDADQIATLLLAVVLTLLTLPSVISGIIVLVSRNKQHV